MTKRVGPAQLADRTRTGSNRVTAAQARRAALYVAAHAVDREDCWQLLDALGLTDRPLQSSAEVRYQRRRHSHRKEQP